MLYRPITCACGESETGARILVWSDRGTPGFPTPVRLPQKCLPQAASHGGKGKAAGPSAGGFAVRSALNLGKSRRKTTPTSPRIARGGGGDHRAASWQVSFLRDLRRGPRAAGADEMRATINRSVVLAPKSQHVYSFLLRGLPFCVPRHWQWLLRFPLRCRETLHLQGRPRQ